MGRALDPGVAHRRLDRRSADLERQLENTVEYVFAIDIRTTPERLWDSTTDPDQRAQYNFGSRVESDGTQGSPFAMLHPSESDPIGGGENLEVDPPRRPVQTMRALWGPAVIAEGTSRLTWETDPIGDSRRLTSHTTSSATDPTISSSAGGR